MSHGRKCRAGSLFKTSPYEISTGTPRPDPTLTLTQRLQGKKHCFLFVCLARIAPESPIGGGTGVSKGAPGVGTTSRTSVEPPEKLLSKGLHVQFPTSFLREAAAVEIKSGFLQLFNSSRPCFVVYQGSSRCISIGHRTREKPGIDGSAFT